MHKAPAVDSNYVLKIKFIFLGYFDPVHDILIIKHNTIRGDLTDVSAKTKNTGYESLLQHNGGLSERWNGLYLIKLAIFYFSTLF